jgi:hypothetical protein
LVRSSFPFELMLVCRHTWRNAGKRSVRTRTSNQTSRSAHRAGASRRPGPRSPAQRGDKTSEGVARMRGSSMRKNRERVGPEIPGVLFGERMMPGRSSKETGGPKFCGIRAGAHRAIATDPCSSVVSQSILRLAPWGIRTISPPQTHSSCRQTGSGWDSIPNSRNTSLTILS